MIKKNSVKIKFLSIIMAVFMILGEIIILPSKTAYALDLPQITIENARVPYSANDQDVEVTVNLSNAVVDIKLLALDIKYDNTKLTFKSDSNKLDDSMLVNPYVASGSGSNDTVAIGFTSAQGVTVSQSNYLRMVTLKFTVKGGTPSNTSIPLVALDDAANSTPQINISGNLHTTNLNSTNKISVNAGAITVVSPPVLTAGSVSRDSASGATVKFTSTKSGKYFYVVEQGEGGPPDEFASGAEYIIDYGSTPIPKGVSCEAGENTITLTDLQDAASKRIFIIEKDTGNNVSNSVKMIIPAFTSKEVTYTLTYTAGANGSISGTTSQTVNSRASGTAVTAVPNDGYHFVSWSDGVTTASRTDINITANKNVIAYFAADTLLPAQISNLTAIPGDRKVTLNFDAPTGATNVIVEQSIDRTNYMITTSSAIAATSTNAEVIGLNNGQEYSFRLLVTGGIRAGTSNVASATPQATILSAIAIDDLTAITGDGEVTLKFSAPTGATSVIVQQYIDGLNYVTATTSSAITVTSTSTKVTGLTNGTQYKFRLIVTGGMRAGILMWYQ